MFIIIFSFVAPSLIFQTDASNFIFNTFYSANSAFSSNSFFIIYYFQVFCVFISYLKFWAAHYSVNVFDDKTMETIFAMKNDGKHKSGWNV